jgi:hypothetical protein
MQDEELLVLLHALLSIGYPQPGIVIMIVYFCWLSSFTASFFHILWPQIVGTVPSGPAIKQSNGKSPNVVP